MINITFPDGAQRAYPAGTTGLEIAKGISPSLAKRTVAMVLDGVTADLSDRIARDASLEFLSRDDPRSLVLIRHDAAHVLAEAVQALYPGTQVTIGPVIDEGFLLRFSIASSRSRRRISPASKPRCARSSDATDPLPRRSGAARRRAPSSSGRAKPSRSNSSTPSRPTRISTSIARATGSTFAAVRT